MTKFAAYMARILLWESCKFGEKIFYSNWNNEFFLRDCFLLAHPVDISSLLVQVKINRSNNDNNKNDGPTWPMYFYPTVLRT